MDRCFQGNLSVYFLNLLLCGLKSNACMASLGTRWGFRRLKPVLRPFSLRGMWYSFSKPVLHVPNIERDTELRSDGSLNSTQSFVLMVHSIRVHGGSGHLPKAYPAKVVVEQWDLFLDLVKDSASRAAVLVGAYTSTRRAVSDYYGVIVFFKYPTQCSKSLSGVLKFRLWSLI